MNKAELTLTRALEILGPNGENWAKKYFATNHCGGQERVLSPAAVCFCSGGAVARAIGYEPGKLFNKSTHGLLYWFCGQLLSEAATELYELRSFHRVNDDDDKTFRDVRAMFARALELAAKKGGRA